MGDQNADAVAPSFGENGARRVAGLGSLLGGGAGADLELARQRGAHERKK